MATQGFVNFKAVKARVSIRDVLERYGLLGRLTQKGSRLVGLCPIHHKGGPTPGKSHPQQFSVDLAKNAWKCFAGSCGKSGNQIDLVAALEQIEFRAAALLMQSWVPDVQAAPHQEGPQPLDGLRVVVERAAVQVPGQGDSGAFGLASGHPFHVEGRLGKLLAAERLHHLARDAVLSQLRLDHAPSPRAVTVALLGPPSREGDVVD